MTRNKTILAWIANDTSRKATLKKRREGIFKKAKELSILCDMKAGVVVYSPDEEYATVWPSPSDMKQMLEKFLSMSVVVRSQKRVTHEGFLTNMVAKETEKRNNRRRENNKKEIQENMNKIFEGGDLYELDVKQLNTLTLLTADKLSQLEERERARHRQVPDSPVPPPAPPPLPEMLVADEIIKDHTSSEHVGSSTATSMRHLMSDNWFMETMDYNMNIPDANVGSGMGLPSEYVASIISKDDELPEDLDALFPHIHSP